MCKSVCRVLSVSGTPAHSVSLDLCADSLGGKVNYEPLLRCLALENRKAGGYFMHYLRDKESKVYINCLRFWREVQEYKALFVRVSFSPCSVEMKAKVFYYYLLAEHLYIIYSYIGSLWSLHL